MSQIVRKRLISQIEEVIGRPGETGSAPEIVRSIALIGHPGIGKKTLAQQYIADTASKHEMLDLSRASDINALKSFIDTHHPFSGVIVIEGLPQHLTLLIALRDAIKEGHFRESRFIFISSTFRDFDHINENGFYGIPCRLLPVMPMTCLEEADIPLSSASGPPSFTPAETQAVEDGTTLTRQQFRMLRGGYPSSLLAASIEDSITIRQLLFENALENVARHAGAQCEVDLLTQIARHVANGKSFSNLRDVRRGTSAELILRHLRVLHDEGMITTLPAWRLDQPKEPSFSANPYKEHNFCLRSDPELCLPANGFLQVEKSWRKLPENWQATAGGLFEAEIVTIVRDVATFSGLNIGMSHFRVHENCRNGKLEAGNEIDLVIRLPSGKTLWSEIKLSKRQPRPGFFRIMKEFKEFQKNCAFYNIQGSPSENEIKEYSSVSVGDFIKNLSEYSSK